MTRKKRRKNVMLYTYTIAQSPIDQRPLLKMVRISFLGQVVSMPQLNVHAASKSVYSAHTVHLGNCKNFEV